MAEAQAEAARSTAPARRPGMIPRALAAWGDLGGSIRAELAAEPKEATVFAWMMIALALTGLAQLPAELLLPAPAGMERAPGAGFAVRVTLAPLMFYAIAGISGLIGRLLGGTLGYFGHRVVWFWFLLVMAPPMLAAALLQLPLHALAGPVVAGIPQIAVSLLSLYVLWRFFAAARGRG